VLADLVADHTDSLSQCAAALAIRPVLKRA